MNQDQQGDQAVQAIADWMRHVDQDGYYGGEPGAVHAQRDARALYRSVVAPLLAERDRELERWRTGLRRHSWPTVESVPDGLQYAAALARAQGTEGGDEHDELLRQAAIRLRDLSDVARVLLADRARVEASRRDWAADAMQLDMAAEATHCCTGAHNCSANAHIDGCFYSDEEDPRHPRYVLPCGHTNAEAQRSVRHELCRLHPEGGGSDG